MKRWQIQYTYEGGEPEGEGWTWIGSGEDQYGRYDAWKKPDTSGRARRPRQAPPRRHVDVAPHAVDEWMYGNNYKGRRADERAEREQKARRGRR